MVLAIGMVVDDAIVVTENIHRHIAKGKSPLEASLIGAREIQFAIISMTLTLAAVYAPIGFLTGLVGSLFKEFAFTLAGAVIISGIIALTLSPMMCSKIMLPHTAGEFFMLIPFILLAYLFMLATSLYIGSITLLVKQTTTIVRIVLYIVRILAGYFFTIAFFGGYSGWLSAVVVCLPIAAGQFAMRKYLIEHNTSADFFGFAYWQILLINLAVCIVLLVGAYFFTKGMTKVARKRGTIEFY